MNDKITQVDGKFYKKCKVVMLATKHAVRWGGHIWLNQTTNKLNQYTTNEVGNFKPQHLYILSDEEIKEGDWVYNEVDKNVVQILKDIRHECKTDKKIIATTDSSLGLSRPSDAFVQKFVEEYNKYHITHSDSIITEVLVEYEEVPSKRIITGMCMGGEVEGYWQKQPHILKTAPDNTITIKPVVETWDDIFDKFNREIADHTISFVTASDLANWLKEHYQAPKKK